MRRPSRNIEIFSMSVLDMFASALGAFIMVAIILFPYYQKNKPLKEQLDSEVTELKRLQEDVDKTKAAAEKIEQQIEDVKNQIAKAQLANAALNTCRQGVQACLVELGATFLLVKIDWSAGGVDVDLHVTDPQGNEFFFRRTNRNGQTFPNSKGRLSTDSVRFSGGGVEVWQIPVADPGSYLIDYVVESDPGTNVPVRGMVFDKSGKKALPEQTLNGSTRRIRAGTVEITADGRVTLR